MNPKRKSRLLYSDHRSHIRGIPIYSPQRRNTLFQLRTLALIATIAGSAILPHTLLETKTNQSNFQYSMSYGRQTTTESIRSESKCDNSPHQTHSNKPSISDLKTVVEDAIYTDHQNPHQFPESTKAILAKHLIEMEELSEKIFQENRVGKPAGPALVAHRLKAIQKTEEYFKSKKLPTLLNLTEFTKNELLESTPEKTLTAAQALLQSPSKQKQIAGGKLQKANSNFEPSF
jgi:hypothetical protein